MKVTIYIVIVLVIVSIAFYYYKDKDNDNDNGNIPSLVNHYNIKQSPYLIVDSSHAVNVLNAYLNNYKYYYYNLIKTYKCEIFRDSFWIVQTSNLTTHLLKEPFIVLNAYSGEVIAFHFDYKHKTKENDSQSIKILIDSILTNRYNKKK